MFNRVIDSFIYIFIFVSDRLSNIRFKVTEIIMSLKRSKSKEREKKQRQRMNLTEEQKTDRRNKDAENKKKVRNLETAEQKLQRIEALDAYNKRRTQVIRQTGSVENKRKKLRLDKGIGVNDGAPTSWISKSLKEMNYDERKEYMAHIKKRSRNLEIETKKDILKQQYRKENYKRTFARYRQKRTEDLRDSEEIEHEIDKDMLKRYLKREETDIKKYSFTV